MLLLLACAHKLRAVLPVLPLERLLCNSASLPTCRTRVAQAQQQEQPLPPLHTQTSSAAAKAAHASAAQQRRLMGARVVLHPSAAAARLGRVNTLLAAQI